MYRNNENERSKPAKSGLTCVKSSFGLLPSTCIF